MVNSMDAFFDAVGFLAGVIIAVSLIPQLRRTCKRKSATDFSYMWQIILMVGLGFQLIYLYHFDLWAAFVPLGCEYIMLAVLAGLKIYYQERKPASGESNSTPLLAVGNEDLVTGASGLEEAKVHG